MSASLLVKGPNTVRLLQTNTKILICGSVPTDGGVAWDSVAGTFAFLTAVSFPTGTILFITVPPGTGWAGPYIVLAPGFSGTVLPASLLSSPYTAASGTVSVQSILPTTYVVTIKSTSSTTEDSPIANLDVVQSNGEPVLLQAVPYGAEGLGRGAILTTAAEGAYEIIGADRQPVTLVSVLASSLTE